MVGEEENRSLFFPSRARKERKEKENNVCVQATFCGGRKQALTKFSFFFSELRYGWKALSSAEAPAGYP